MPDLQGLAHVYSRVWIYALYVFIVRRFYTVLADLSYQTPQLRFSYFVVQYLFTPFIFIGK